MDYYDYKKYYVLYVDDEEKSLKYFRETFGDKFAILTAPSAEAGFQILKENKDNVAILVTDQRMPGLKGTELLEKARMLNHRVIRILVTAYSDLETAIDAVNTGAIYKYVTKPWDIPQFETTLRRGLEFFIVQKQRDHLLYEKMTTLYNVMLMDRVLSLGILATGLSHHLRNSLTAVKTFLDLAPRKLAEENIELDQMRHPDFWKDYYQKVQKQMDRMALLLSELFESAEGPTTGFVDKIALKPLVEEEIGKLRGELGEKKIAVENRIPQDLPELRADAKKIRRLFEMLLRDEGVSLASKGGKVQITAKVVGLKEGPSEVHIEVVDDGPELSQQALRSVFDPFFVRSGDYQEFGIYLMTCFFIVYHHGGRISVKREESRGNIFEIILPLAPPTQPPTAEKRDFISNMLINESMWEKILSEN